MSYQVIPPISKLILTSTVGEVEKVQRNLEILTELFSSNITKTVEQKDKKEGRSLKIKISKSKNHLYTNKIKFNSRNEKVRKSDYYWIGKKS